MGSILGFIGTLKGALIGGALIGIVSMGIGWRAHQILVAAKEAKTLQAKIDAKDKLLKIQIDISSTLLTNMSKALSNARNSNRDVLRRIPSVVPKNTPTCSCDLGPEFVGVFNRAALGGVSPDSSSDTDGKVPGNAIDPTNRH